LLKKFTHGIFPLKSSLRGCLEKKAKNRTFSRSVESSPLISELYKAGQTEWAVDHVIDYTLHSRIFTLWYKDAPKTVLQNIYIFITEKKSGSRCGK
jgi:hypothetical protein